MITAGTDIGSVATKVVILRHNFIIASEVPPSSSQPKLTDDKALANALVKAKLTREQVDRVVSTGYGRRIMVMSI